MEIEPVFKSYGGVKLAGWQQGRFCKGVGIAQGGSATNVDPVQPVQDLTVVFVLYRSERHLSIAGGFFFEHKHKYLLNKIIFSQRSCKLWPGESFKVGCMPESAVRKSVRREDYKY